MAKEAKKYWDSEEIVGEVVLSDKQKRVISHVSKGDENFVALSTWKFYKPKDAPEAAWYPTGGVTIPLGCYEGQAVFNHIAQFFGSPQTPEQMKERAKNSGKATRKAGDAQ